MASFKYNDQHVVVFGTYYKQIFGDRDRFGGKLEPDEPAHWEIEEIFIDGVEIDIDSLDCMLDYYNFIDLCERALQSDFLEY